MYSENEDYEEDYKNNNGSLSDKIRDFYENNKKLVLILGGLLLLVIVLSMFNSCSKNPQGTGNNTNLEFSVTPEESDLSVGNTLRLITDIKPDGDYRTATYSWNSSNEEVATVDKFGNVNALKIGSTLITVKMVYNDKPYEKVSKINVIEGNKDIELREVAFPDGEVLITKGDTFKLYKTTTPSNGYINKLVYTSSNTSIVEVDGEGQIKALSTGTAIIRMNVNDDKFSDEIKVNVVNEKVDARIIENPRIITFDDKNVLLTIGENKQLSYQVLPEDAYLGNLKWSSSDGFVAKVDENGVVTGITEGTAVITVKSGDEVEESIAVEVKKGIVNVTDVTVLTATHLNLNIGESDTIIPNVSPSNATDKTVTYSSSDSYVAVVNNNGVVTGVSAGTSVITVMTNDGSKTATVVVTVNSTSSDSGSSSGGSSSGSSGGSSKVNVTSIVAPLTSKDITVYEKYVFTPTVYPTNATDKSFTCLTSNSSVATDSKSGTECTVTGKEVGTAVITVKTNDGAKTDKVTINVKSSNSGSSSSSQIKVQGINVTSSLTLTVGSSKDISATPTNATNKKITCKLVSGSGVSISTNSSRTTCTITGIFANTSQPAVVSIISDDGGINKNLTVKVSGSTSGSSSSSLKVTWEYKRICDVRSIYGK